MIMSPYVIFGTNAIFIPLSLTLSCASYLLQSSSTTSSSSQRTFTSTSSKHPLPARPDWAVGLKVTNHPHHSNPHSRTMSPARIGGHLNQHGNHQLPRQVQQQPTLQATDFPPLSSGPEKKVAPVAAGAWTNASSIRSVISSANSPPGASGNALVHYPSNQSSPSIPAASNGRPDELEPGFERPPPRSNAELFNPKAPSKRTPVSRGNSYPGTPDEKSSDVGRGSDNPRVDTGVNDAVIDTLAGLELTDWIGPTIVNEPEAVAEVTNVRGGGSLSLQL